MIDIQQLLAWELSPGPKEQMTIRMSPKELTELKKIAQRESVNVAMLVRYFVRLGLGASQKGFKNGKKS